VCVILLYSFSSEASGVPYYNLTYTTGARSIGLPSTQLTISET
jgi:hypothetical protein